MKNIRLLFFIIALLSFTSCEKVSLEELLGNENKEETDKGNDTQGDAAITVNVKGFDRIAYNEQQNEDDNVSLRDVCSRVSVALYRNGERIYYKNQKATDEEFGKIQIAATEGEYTLLVLGYSNTETATTTDLQKITFGGKVTDTFHYCRNIEIASGENNIDVVLKRIVGMFRLVIEDNIPDNAAQLKFYYTGGSSTLDGQSACGCVNSRQTEYREMTQDLKTFDIYTFPHAEAQPLNIKVTALDANGNAICEKQFANVTVKQNYMTIFSGTFFNGAGTSSKEITGNIKVDTTWDGSIEDRY